MKKTLLATAIAGAIAATGMMATTAQAATVYDQDGTRLDLYGRIALGVQGGGPEVNEEGEKINGSEFRDVYSRFGLRGTQRVSDDLTAFGVQLVAPKRVGVHGDLSTHLRHLLRCLLEGSLDVAR